LLVLWFNPQDVKANAFSSSWLAEQTVPYGLLQGCWNGIFGEGFQLKHWVPPEIEKTELGPG
jgi:hypothetical protein